MSATDREIKQLQAVQKSLAIAAKTTSSVLLDAKKKHRKAAPATRKPAKKAGAKKAKKTGAKKAKK